MSDPGNGTDLAPLAELVDDARHLPLAMLPRPRRPQQVTIDLSTHELRIPEDAASLLDGYADYGV
jgi:hypothetical protein